MNLRDLLRPERAMAFAFKLFGLILALLMIPELLGRFMREIRLTPHEVLTLMVLFAIASPIAFLIRERRHRRPMRREARRGAERAPLPPPDEEEDE